MKKEDNFLQIEYFIGIDIGKTKIAIGIIDTLGNILHRYEVLTNILSAETILNQCRLLVEECLSFMGHTPLSIGIGSTGIIDHINKKVISSGSITSWNDIYIGRLFEDEYGIPVYLENDVIAAGIGEHILGIGKECKSSVYLSIGTSVGISVIINNIVIRGSHNLAGQIAFLKTINSDMTITELFGGKGMANRLSNIRNTNLTTKELFDLANSGYPDAIKILSEAAIGVAHVITWIQNVIDPEIIILGGGIINKNPNFLELIKSNTNLIISNKYKERLNGEINLVHSKFKGDAGIVGAASLCFSNTLLL
jgi:glucokinase